MSEWSDGYMADIGYTYGYYTELNPQRIRLPFLASGQAFPDIEAESGTACELGFGQGLSVTIHAAASGVSWFGTDFNPSQAGFAREMVNACGAGASLFDQAFAEFCSRPDLPDFDYIGLHGIWSWISDENRHVIVDFLRRKLKVGGVLYISYNCQPGWAAVAPMQELLNRHAAVLGASGQDIAGRINTAFDFAERLFAVKPLYALANPQVAERVKKMREQNPNYLAHEYFNRNWVPMTFASMAEWLSPAKLNFACSAHYLDHVDALNLSTEQQAFLKEIPDVALREMVRDFMCNTQFRRDYWVKGSRRLGGVEQRELLLEQRVILARARHEVTLKVKGARSESTLHENIYAPLLDLLADHKPRSLGQLEQALRGNNITLAQILQAVLILIGKGDLMPVQDEAAIAKSKRMTDKINLHLMRKCRGSSDFSYLASPVTGGGLPVNRFQQLFLLACGQGLKQPQEWAQFVWRHLEALNQRLMREGQPIDTPEENLAELTRQAHEFAEKRLPLLKALQIA